MKNNNRVRTHSLLCSDSLLSYFRTTLTVIRFSFAKTVLRRLVALRKVYRLERTQSGVTIRGHNQGSQSGGSQSGDTIESTGQVVQLSPTCTGSPRGSFKSLLLVLLLQLLRPCRRHGRRTAVMAAAMAGQGTTGRATVERAPDGGAGDDLRWRRGRRRQQRRGRRRLKRRGRRRWRSRAEGAGPLAQQKEQRALALAVQLGGSCQLSLAKRWVCIAARQRRRRRRRRRCCAADAKELDKKEGAPYLHVGQAHHHGRGSVHRTISGVRVRVKAGSCGCDRRVDILMRKGTRMGGWLVDSLGTG